MPKQEGSVDFSYYNSAEVKFLRVSNLIIVKKKTNILHYRRGIQIEIL